MKVIDAQKLRDYFYYGINDKPIISPEIDKNVIEAIDNCTIEIKEGQIRDMEIKISLSDLELERIKNVLGITSYDDIHTSIIDAYNRMLDTTENELNYLFADIA